MSQEDVLRRQLARERSARQQAENLLEAKSRELYDANRELESRRFSLQKAVEERTAELEESTARIRAILESAVSGIITIDRSGLIDSFNAAACKIFGYSSDEITGQNVSRLMPRPFSDHHDGYIRSYLETGRPRIIGSGREMVGLRKDGTTFPMYLSVSEVTTGERLLFTGIVNDLSEQKATEIALAKARERESKLGGRIQKTLLFGQPPKDLVGLEVAAISAPSQNVDGDFIDFFRNDDMCIDVLIGDVMGKGILAALIGAGAKTNFLRALHKLTTGTQLPQLTTVVEAVDSVLTPELVQHEIFLTALFARISRATGKVEFVDCGHTGVLHYDSRAGRCSVHKGQNLPLGVLEDETFQQADIDINTGDFLIFYSDGLTEARSPGGELYGEERLMRHIVNHHDLSAEELGNSIKAAVTEFAATETFRDDLTCVVIRLVAGFPDDADVSRELSIPSNTDELKRVRSFIGDSLSDAGIDEPTWRNELVTAVHETITNIMRHAYFGQRDKPIHIRLEYSATEAIVRISHRGVGLKRHSMPSPTFDGTKDGGFGLYLIDNMVDRIAYYQNTRGEDTTVLIKRLPRQ